MDMLKVCDRISNMSVAFGTVQSSVTDVLQLCASFKEDYVYSSADTTNGEDHAIITQEMLWEEFDNADMLKLAKDLALFQHCRSSIRSASRIEGSRYASLNEEFFTEFPAIASSKCIALLLQTNELPSEVAAPGKPHS